MYVFIQTFVECHFQNVWTNMCNIKVAEILLYLSIYLYVFLNTYWNLLRTYDCITFISISARTIVFKCTYFWFFLDVDFICIYLRMFWQVFLYICTYNCACLHVTLIVSVFSSFHIWSCLHVLCSVCICLCYHSYLFPSTNRASACSYIHQTSIRYIKTVTVSTVWYVMRMS